jgi:hypothetical protein
MSRDALRPENRMQMFCYYNTLAWEVLAATIAAVIVLATLPFAVGPNLANKDMYFVFNETFAGLIFAGGIFFTYRIRGYAVMWAHLPTEDYSTSIRAWIDWVETSPRQTSPSTRATTTNIFMLFFVSLGAAYFLISAFLWFLR